MVDYVTNSVNHRVINSNRINEYKFIDGAEIPLGEFNKPTQIIFSKNNASKKIEAEINWQDIDELTYTIKMKNGKTKIEIDIFEGIVTLYTNMDFTYLVPYKIYPKKSTDIQPRYLPIIVSEEINQTNFKNTLNIKVLLSNEIKELTVNLKFKDNKLNIYTKDINLLFNFRKCNVNIFTKNRLGTTITLFSLLMKNFI